MSFVLIDMSMKGAIGEVAFARRFGRVFLMTPVPVDGGFMLGIATSGSVGYLVRDNGDRRVFRREASIKNAMARINRHAIREEFRMKEQNRRWRESFDRRLERLGVRE